MDNRCPRQLEEVPDTWCPLAVLRLKSIRNAGQELSEEEEAKLPGCPWAVDHQLANYCFFKYIKAPSDMEIASLLNVSTETVKKIEKIALGKMREDDAFSNMQSNDEPVVKEGSDDYKVHR
jgi:hypothetical protein